MRTLFFFGAVLLIAFPGWADSSAAKAQSASAAPITFDNWLTHPEIQKIRKLYTAVQGDKSLVPTTRTFEICIKGTNEAKRTIFRDGQGRVRLYRSEFVDPATSFLASTENMYDLNGQLRFSYMVDTVKNAKHEKTERRLYFAENGEKLWEIWKHPDQDFYFPPEYESMDSVVEPEQAFDQPGPCPETVFEQDNSQAKDASDLKTQIHSQKAADMLLGRHMFSLQWISWDYFGSATVTDKNGLLHISGRQDGRPGAEEAGSFVSIDGVITEVREKSFVFRGEVVTKVSHIAGGRECVRSGDMVFAISGARKYWRMQDMENPCDSVADYVDIFF